ncbi:MAG TPA: alpha/beta hydrolase [Phycisphaerales bacterium]|nr:alpha/beta hydrolase [Phycisphaerales bacterium]
MERLCRTSRLMWTACAVVFATAGSAHARQDVVQPAAPSQPASSPAPLLVARKPLEKPIPTIPLTPIEKFEKRGTGKITLILIPDYGMDWRAWETFMERNQARYTMYAINLPGIGGTTMPAEMPEDAFYADGVWTQNLEKALLKLMEDEKLDKPFIVGYSYGGHMALRMAIHHHEKIGGAISMDGTVTVHLPNQKGPRMPIQDREAFVAQTMSAGQKIADDVFMERQRTGLKSVITDPQRAEFISSLVDSVPKKVLLQYMGEYYAADQWQYIADLKTPVAVLVSIPSGAEAALSRASKQKWERWFLAAKQNLDLIWFENTNPIMTESAPFELDRAVHAFVHGNFVQGKTKYSKPMTEYVAPEEGGEAELPRPSVSAGAAAENPAEAPVTDGGSPDSAEQPK